MAAETPTLLDEMRAEIACQRQLIIESHCLLDADLLPILDTLEDVARPEVERLDALLAKIDAALTQERA